MKNNGYINIQGFMINELDLSGNELILYAIIFGFSQDGKSQYRGSLSYIENALRISRNTAIRTLKKLLDKGLITKEFNSKGNLYRITSAKVELVEEDEVVPKLHQSSAKVALVSSAKVEHNNNNYINKDNNNTYSVDFELFWKEYPKKVNKKKAFEFWKKLKPDLEFSAKIIRSVIQRKNETDWTKEGSRFVVHPERFIRDKRWEDEIIKNKIERVVI